MKKKNETNLFTKSIIQETKSNEFANNNSSSEIFELSKDSAIIQKNNWKAFVVLVCGLALTILVAFYAQKDENEKSRSDFISICEEIKLKISDRLHAHALLLRTGAAFFTAKKSVSRSDWKKFIADIEIDRNLPGIQGVGFSLIVPKNKLKSHTENIRREGFPDYTIQPEGDREFYTSAIYLEPFAGRNLKAFGYDMYTEKVSRKAMERSRDSDLATLSGKIILVQETKEDIQAGTLMYVPVYSNEKPSNTVEQRRAAILGWVYSPFRMNDLMKDTLDRGEIIDKEKINLLVYDDSVSTNSLMYDSRKKDSIRNNNSQGQTISLAINFNGIKWALVFTKAQVNPFYFQSITIVVITCGSLISLLLFILFLSLFNTRRNALLLAEKSNIESKENVNKYKDLSTLLESIIDHVPGLLFYKDTKNNFIRVNKFIAEAIGKNKAEIEGKNLSKFYSKEDAEKYYRDDLEVINSGVAKLNIQEEWKTSKAVTWLNTSKIPFADAEGKIIGIIGMSMDISESKKIEIEREQFFKFFNISSDIMVIADPNGCFQKINPACLDVLGYSETELLSKPFIDFVHPDDRQNTLDEMANQIKTGKSMNFENHYLCKDGSSKILSWRAAYIANEGITYATARDITERKEEEERLKLLETVIINTTDAVVITEAFPFENPGPKIIYVNDSYYKMTGYRREEIIGKTPRILQGVNTDKNELQRLKKAIENNVPCEIEVINYKKSGEEFWTSINISPVLNEKGIPIYWVGIKRDITESKKQDQNIKKAIISAQEREQYFIGRELHDNIAQILVGSMLSLGMVKGNNEKEIEWLAQTKESIHDSILEIRKLSHHLAPVKLENDNFISTIEELLKSINLEKKYKIITHFDKLDNANLSSDLQLNLYRILQEQLQNIIKHATASEIEISIRLIENILRLRIFDNGKGFNMATSNDGIGLQNIKNRAEIFSGHCIIKSSPGNGCELLIKIPLQ